MRNKDTIVCRVPRDVVERAREIAPVLGSTLGELIANAVRPVLPALEEQALSRFKAKTGEKTRSGQ